MANKDTLRPKPFQKGESGNPNGRPVGSRNVSTILKEMMESLAPDELVNAKFVKEFCKGKKKVTTADAIAARLINEGLIKGEPWAMKEILDRTEGKAKQGLELTGKDGAPIKTESTLILDFNGADDGNSSSSGNEPG
jgi:hypothetical protein